MPTYVISSKEIKKLTDFIGNYLSVEFDEETGSMSLCKFDQRDCTLKRQKVRFSEANDYLDEDEAKAFIEMLNNPDPERVKLRKDTVERAKRIFDIHSKEK
jgi:hypothetical protein